MSRNCCRPLKSRWIALAFVLATIESMGGCSSGVQSHGALEGCEPQCNLGCGMGDGCGSVCGCAAGLECGATGQCLAAGACVQRCEDAGYQCGEVCGERCGTCSDSSICVDGACIEEQGRSCEGCGVSIQTAEQTNLEDGSTEVVLVVALDVPSGVDSPRMFDIRLESDRDLTILEVTEGEALRAAKKSLFASPSTGQLYRRKSDGTYQFLGLALDNVERIGSGELFRVRIRFRSESAMVRLTRRDQTLAPPSADLLLQSGAYDAPVVVLR